MIIKAISPFIYGFYLWVRHLSHGVNSAYLWSYLSRNYVFFYHSALFIYKRDDMSIMDQYQTLVEVEKKLQATFSKGQP